MSKNSSKQPDQQEEPLALGIGGSAETDIGTIFVNDEYRIKRFVSTVTELINYHSFNKDHAIEDFTSRLKYDQFKEDIDTVLKTKEKIQKEVPDINGHCYILELQPYLTKNKVEGVVVTFVDVTELKESQNELKEKVKQVKELQRQIIKNDVSERWEIGRYLHDELAQLLLSAKFSASHVKGNLEKEGSEHTGEIDQLLDILDRSIAGARDLSHEIVPIDVEEEGVSHAFRNLAQQMEKRHDLNCQLNFDDTVNKLDDIELATHLYRVAHEAAKNAAVHGGSKNIIITLKSDSTNLYLVIEDDGTGFSNTDKVKGGMGINIMRHRMELIGGTLQVKDSTDPENNGAMISCTVPLERMGMNGIENR